MKSTSNSSEKEIEVLIIGAGPSGTAAAAILQKNNIQAIVVEKSQFPRFSIGESLLPKCMEPLEKAGLLDVLKKANFQKKKGAMFSRNGQITEFQFANKYSDGYDWTWQVPRAEFDDLIAKEVESRGVAYLYQQSVEDVEFKENEVITTVLGKDNVVTKIKSKFIIDASGFGRVLPRLLDLNKPSDLPSRSAIFAHFEDEDRSKDFMDSIQIIVLSEKIWGWIIPFSNGKSSIGIVGDLEDRTDHEEYFNELIDQNQYLRENYSDLKLDFDFRRIDGYSIGVKQFYGDKYVLTGNSTEFLDPVFSSGVTFALESGVLAASLVVKQLNGEPVNWQDEYVTPVQSGVDTFKAFIEAWYQGDLQTIIFSKGFNLKIKQQICSILAGYVWDTSNPYVKKHSYALQTLAKVIRISERT